MKIHRVDSDLLLGSGAAKGWKDMDAVASTDMLQPSFQRESMVSLTVQYCLSVADDAELSMTAVRQKNDILSAIIVF